MQNLPHTYIFILLNIRRWLFPEILSLSNFENLVEFYSECYFVNIFQQRDLTTPLALIWKLEKLDLAVRGVELDLFIFCHYDGHSLYYIRKEVNMYFIVS